MNIDLLKPAWYVLHVKSRFENVVNEGLIKKSFETFLPKMRVRSKRRDRHKMIHVPLFPGYTFVRTSLDPQLHLEVVKIVGAVKLIGNLTGPPVPVPDDVIDSLRIMVNASEAIVTGTRFKKGEQVMVMAGPFAGVTTTPPIARGTPPPAERSNRPGSAWSETAAAKRHAVTSGMGRRFFIYQRLRRDASVPRELNSPSLYRGEYLHLPAPHR